jgi:hypothetical protein
VYLSINLPFPLRNLLSPLQPPWKGKWSGGWMGYLSLGLLK